MFKRIILSILIIYSCFFTISVSAQSGASLKIKNVDNEVAFYEDNTVTYLELNTFATADIILSTTTAFEKVAIRASIPDGVNVEADISGNGDWVQIKDGQFFGSINGFDVPANITNVTQVRIKLTKGGSFTTRMDLIHVERPENPIYSLETILKAPYSTYLIDIPSSRNATVGESLEIPFNILSDDVRAAGYDNAALEIDIVPSADFTLYTEEIQQPLIQEEGKSYLPIVLTASYDQTFRLKTKIEQPGNHTVFLSLVDQDSGRLIASNGVIIPIHDNGNPKTGDKGFNIQFLILSICSGFIIMLITKRKEIFKSPSAAKMDSLTT